MIIWLRLVPLLLLLSLDAWATTPSSMKFMPQSTLAQKQLNQLIIKQDWKGAFQTWKQAFPTSQFYRITTQRALYDLLAFHNGLQSLALSDLFAIKSPSQIHPQIRQLWRSTVKSSDPIWSWAPIRWTSAWKVVFPEVGERQPYFSSLPLNRVSTLAHLEKKLKSKWLDPQDRTWSQWQLALAELQFNKNKKALQHLDQIFDSEQDLISEDRISMAMARAYFQDRQYNKALDLYKNIPRQSELWLESIEEKAYTYYRLNELGSALAELKTALAGVFKPQLGPEPYFLASFIHLKTCNYASVFDLTRNFKKRYRDRTQELQKLSNQGTSPSSQQLLASSGPETLNWKSLGYKSHSLPRLFYRDKFFHRSWKRLQRARLESHQVIQKVNYSDLQSAWQSRAQSVVQGEQKSARKRLQSLATEDLSEMSKILQKLNLVEAETIQRLHLLKSASLRSNRWDQKPSSDYLVFPVSSKTSVWLDELDHFDVKVKGCPTLKGQVLSQGGKAP